MLVKDAVFPFGNAGRLAPGDPCHVIVISDTRLVRDALSGGLASETGLQVAAAVSSAQAIDAAIMAQPHAAVIDAAVRGGIALLRLLKQAMPRLQIVVCGLGENDVDLVDWFRAGAIGCCSHDDGPAELAEAVRCAASGRLACTPRLAALLLSRVAQPSARVSTQRHAHGLTPRELQICGLLRAGQSNKEMARQLQISEATVKNHVHNVLEKLQVRSRWQAAARLGSELEVVKG